MKDVQIFENQVCFTVFSSPAYQVFYTEQSHFVFDKHAQLIYEIEMDAWTNLVFELEQLQTK